MSPNAMNLIHLIKDDKIVFTSHKIDSEITKIAIDNHYDDYFNELISEKIIISFEIEKIHVKNGRVMQMIYHVKGLKNEK